MHINADKFTLTLTLSQRERGQPGGEKGGEKEEKRGRECSVENLNNRVS